MNFEQLRGMFVIGAAVQPSNWLHVVLCIKRTAHGYAALVEHMRGDHRCFYVFVSQKLGHGAYVISVLDQVCCETMTKGVAMDALGDARRVRGAMYGFL